MKLELNPDARRTLRAQAHHLNPVVMIGNDGLTPAVLHEIDVNLMSHGLIKIRVFSDDREAREAMLQQIAEDLDAAPVQHIGKLLVVYRPLAEEEETRAPRSSRSPAPPRKSGSRDQRSEDARASPRGRAQARDREPEAASDTRRRRPAEGTQSRSRAGTRSPSAPRTTAGARRPAAPRSKTEARSPAAPRSKTEARSPAAPRSKTGARSPASPRSQPGGPRRPTTRNRTR